MGLQGSTNAKIHSRHFGDRREFTVAKPDFTVDRFVFVIKYLKHRHQRGKAPSLCKTFLITNNCRLKEAGQTKYLFHNVFFTKSFPQRLSHTVFLTRYFSLCLSHNVLFTTSFSHLSPYIALTYSSTQRSPHNLTIIA